MTRLLEEHFGSLVDYRFTAGMEADLDQIAAGERERVRWLEEFYFGGSGVGAVAPTDDDASPSAGGLKGLVENLGEIDPVAVNSVEIGEGLRVRVGRYGPYVEDLSAPVEEGQNPPRASVPEDLAPDELTVEKARELLAAGGDDGRELGVDPATGHQIIAKAGRYGPYVTEVLPEPELPELDPRPARPGRPRRASVRSPSSPSRAQARCSRT